MLKMLCSAGRNRLKIFFVSGQESVVDVGGKRGTHIGGPVSGSAEEAANASTSA